MPTNRPKAPTMAPRPLSLSTPDVGVTVAEVCEPEAPVVGVPFTGVLVAVAVSEPEVPVVGVPFTGVSVLAAVSVSESDGNAGADVDGEAGNGAEVAVLSAVPAVGVGVPPTSKVVFCPFPSVYLPVKMFPLPPVSSWKAPGESSQLPSMEIIGILWSTYQC